MKNRKEGVAHPPTHPPTHLVEGFGILVVDPRRVDGRSELEVEAVGPRGRGHHQREREVLGGVVVGAARPHASPRRRHRRRAVRDAAAQAGHLGELVTVEGDGGGVRGTDGAEGHDDRVEARRHRHEVRLLRPEKLVCD